MTKKILLAAAALLILTTITSCNRKIGSGVILWAPENSELENGSIVHIYEESRINSTYNLALPGEKERVDMETWRVNFFDRANEAEEFAASYEPYTNTYTYTERIGGLIVRDEPVAPGGEKVYKLRQGQEIKVIGRGAEKDPQGSYLDYWYNVLTGDGVTGYAYGATLVVFSLNDSGRVIENAKDTSDPLLDAFLDNTWRPNYYNDMITKQVIDLTSFKESYGLRIDKEKKEISLRLKEINLTEQYTEIISFGSKRYDFEGSSFRVSLVSDRSASVFYRYDGKDINEAFVRLDVNINDVISSELERRDELLAELIEKSDAFTSAAYGSVKLIDDTGRFIWNDISRLKSRDIISAQSDPQGKIGFSLFPDSLIRSIYRGVMTFSFNNGSDAHFLYTYSGNGISLTYVPERYIVNQVVTTNQFFDPIQIYFEFEEKDEKEEDL